MTRHLKILDEYEKINVKVKVHAMTACADT